MYLKLVLIVVTIALAGLMLLSNRQARLNTANEMKVLHENLIDHQQTLWRLQTEIASRIRPADLREALQSLEQDRDLAMAGAGEAGEWTPIPTQTGSSRSLAVPVAQ